VKKALNQERFATEAEINQTHNMSGAELVFPVFLPELQYRSEFFPRISLVETQVTFLTFKIRLGKREDVYLDELSFSTLLIRLLASMLHHMLLSERIDQLCPT